jgi:hypothetical protein
LPFDAICAPPRTRLTGRQSSTAGAHVAATGGHALVAREANLTGGFGAEIATPLWEAGARRVHRLAANDTRIPAAPVLQDAVLPGVADIRAAAPALIGQVALRHDARRRPPRAEDPPPETVLTGFPIPLACYANHRMPRAGRSGHQRGRHGFPGERP